MTNPEEVTLWRNRFILMNLVRIGGTFVVLLALLLWQSDVFVEGGSIIGFPIAIAGLVDQLLRAQICWRGSGARRPGREALLPGRVGRARPHHPARRPPGEDPGAGRSRFAERRARRGGRRRMERAGRDDRPALDAAHRPRQRRDRPGRARSRRLRARPRRLWRIRSPLLPRRRAGAAGRAPGQAVGSGPRLGAAALRRRVRARRRHHPHAPAGRDDRPARRGGRGARSLPACRPLAARHHLRLAADRAGAGRRRARPRRRLGRRDARRAMAGRAMGRGCRSRGRARRAAAAISPPPPASSLCSRLRSGPRPVRLPLPAGGAGSRR